MYDDLFDNEADPSVVSDKQLIEAMRVNIKEKEKLINELVNKISELEDALQVYHEMS